MRPPTAPFAWLIAIAFHTAACGGQDQTLSPLASEGRATYMSACIACHNADPSKDGGLGPAIAGSSRELLEARVVRGEYPPDYTPKRISGVMPAFPHLADEIEALHAYLNESGGSG